MIANATRQNGNDLAITRQFGCKEDNRDEYEQRTEHIHKIRNKIDVIIKDNFFYRYLILKEIVHFLCQIKYYSNTHDKHNRKEECAQEFANNIFVESFQRVLKVLGGFAAV